MARNIHDTYLHTFLGTSRWKRLASTLREESGAQALKELGWEAIIMVFFVSLAPIGISAINNYCAQDLSDLSTITFGIAALLAILFCDRLKRNSPLNQNSDSEKHLPFRATLSNTHTAFALGCIPAVIILALNPNILAERGDIIQEALAPTPATQEQATAVFSLSTIPMVLALTVWVAVTEEYIYRGMLIGGLRRICCLKSQRHRDILAVTTSSVIFGFAHYFSWGLLPALALCGIGAGLGIGFIASRERLATLILYHFLFDSLSIGLNVALVLFR
ncbi:MAG: type II CAAX endopeptidase family protein [bacterium]|nr:type II CAAX endopeptidase family protein [bacterium]